jgi:cardiolipin synthase A/B
MLPRLGDVEPAAADRARGPLRIVGSDGQLMPERRAEIERRLTVEGDSLLAMHLQVMEAVTGSPLVTGNSLRLLKDGPQAYEAMFGAIGTARDHVHIESFIFEELDFGQPLSELLIEKQRAGVTVSIVYDSVGSLATPAAFFDRLRAAGIAVCEFNPVNPLRARMWRLNHRDHRKILVVDGSVAFTGGINFHRVYRTGSSPLRRGMPTLEEGWRDTHVEIRGPAVRAFQELFIGTWEKQHCGPLPARTPFPALASEGGRIVSVIGSSPDGMESRVYLTLISAMTYARRRIYLTVAYFVPDPDTIMALTGAVARGVDVRLVLPGFSDSWAAFHAGRSHYSTLLAGGVRIYERRDSLLHAKTAVIDDVWSTIGSSNVDWRSFCHNDEVNVSILGGEFGREMTALFDDDLAASDEVTLEEWERRGPATRLGEWLARRWEFLL